MAIARRLSTLLTADIHAVIDLAEDPLALLKQAMRDMESEIESQQSLLESYIQNNDGLHTLLNTLHSECKKANKDLNLCFKSDSQNLIRVQIKNKLHLEKRSQNTQSSLEQMQKQIDALTTQLENNRNVFEDMQLKSKSLLIESQLTEAPEKNSYFCDISEHEIDIALLHERSIREQS